MVVMSLLEHELKQELIYYTIQVLNMTILLSPALKDIVAQERQVPQVALALEK